MNDYKIGKFDAKPFVEARQIEYKRVDVDDFRDCHYSVKEVEIIPDSGGFVTKDLFDKIDISTSSTDVLNIPTGSGKTTAIYQKIKQILIEDKSSVIILATPFISLVAKDLKKLTIKYEVDPSIITDYRDLQKDLEKGYARFSFVSKITKAYILNKSIHITTINALLGNPGDVAFEQKSKKSNYFADLLEYCKEGKKNVYLFFDEIHASIHNFKNEYINNLTIWKNVVHKCVVSTATYTEPVNIVVKHLAYLTDDKINILECARIKKPEVSPLDLVFTPETYSVKNSSSVKYILTRWIKDNLNVNNNFHIISYSKKFAKIMQLYLKGAGLDCELLTSETKKSFSDNKNNIGTNFSTGVDIEKTGDLLIVIFPSKYTDELVKGEEGIFYDGLPTILQAMARLRYKGRILLVISPMKGVIDNPITIKLLENIPYYKNFLIPEEKIKFVSETFLSDEKEVLKAYLERRQNKFLEESNRYQSDVKNDGIKRPQLQYPNKETFILERGQEFLKFSNYKSGKYITPYVLWAAVHDQFLNCSLDTVYYLIKEVTKLSLSSENIIDKICSYVIYKENPISSMSFMEYYNKVLEQFFIQTQHDKTSVVKVYLDGKLLSRNQIQTSTKIYFGIVGSYFRQMGYPFTNPDRESYLTLMLTEKIRKGIDDLLETKKCSMYYVALKKIISDFMEQYQRQSFTQGELTNLSFFSEKVVKEIDSIHNQLKIEDPIIYNLNKIGSFWNIARGKGVGDHQSVVKTFLNQYIILGDPGGRYRRREIIGSLLDKGVALDYSYIYRVKVQVAHSGVYRS